MWKHVCKVIKRFIYIEFDLYMILLRLDNTCLRICPEGYKNVRSETDSESICTKVVCYFYFIILFFFLFLLYIYYII
jgi:hypothetical protein